MKRQNHFAEFDYNRVPMITVTCSNFFLVQKLGRNFSLQLTMTEASAKCDHEKSRKPEEADIQ